jgi:hypothetical protein
MKQISITNELDSRTFSAQFENQELAHAWRDEQISINSWGLPQRVIEYIPTGLEARVLSQENKTRTNMNNEEEQYTEYTIKADYVIEETDITTEYNLAKLRAERNIVLSETDKYVLCDYPISAEELVLRKGYRTYLRDITEETPLPSAVKTYAEWNV